MTESHCCKHVLLHLQGRISRRSAQATVRAEWGFLSPGYWGLSAPVWGFLSRGLSAPVWGFLSPGYSAPVWSSLAHEQSQAERKSLAYVYGRETRADADTAHMLTMDEARRIASNIAKLPELSGKG
jgi:hypothetical protein